MKIFNLMTSITFVFLLTSCNNQPQSNQYNYLMQHPKELEVKAMHCQSDATETGDCQTILTAAKDFSELLNEQQHDPERFGKKVLRDEEACAHAENKNTSKACEDVQYELAVLGLTSIE